MLLKLFLQFIIGIGVGVYGYLTPGYINLSILQLSSSKQQSTLMKAMILIAIIEIPYCIVCMSGMQWLMQQLVLMKIISWLIVIVLLMMAVLTILEASKVSKVNQVLEAEIDKNKYKKLFFFVIFNPFQLSAWAIWGAYFIEKQWFNWSLFSISIFSLGAAIGVFVILKIYAFMGQKLVTFFSLQKKYINYGVASILILLALVQFIKNISA